MFQQFERSGEVDTLTRFFLSSAMCAWNRHWPPAKFC